MTTTRWMVATSLLAAAMTSAGWAQTAAPQAAAPQSAPTPPNASPLPHVQAMFDGYVKDDKLPGIVGAFGHGDQIAYVAAGHQADGPGAAAVGPDTLWRVYSMTKPITAVAAMILIDEGKLKLDEPVSDVLPAFKTMRVQLNENTLDSRPATHPITIRNLLTHTAGLGYTIITKGPLLHAYEQQGILPAAISADMEAKMAPVRPKTLQEFANRVARLPLIAEPGTKWSYSIGLDVLGAVIEKASGVPFDTFVTTRIFQPLGMTSSYWTVPRAEVGRLATNYTFVGDTRVATDPAATSAWLSPPTFPYGGAGLVMSTRDYDRFLHMLENRGNLDGKTILKPATADLMMSNLLPPGVTFPGVGGAPAKDTLGGEMGFGAGGSVVLGGPAAGTYGWGGAAGTIAWVNPRNRTRATFMVNYFPSDRYPLREEVVRAYLADILTRR